MGGLARGDGRMKEDPPPPPAQLLQEKQCTFSPQVVLCWEGGRGQGGGERGVEGPHTGEKQ